MRFSSWLTRAGWLGAFAAVSLAGGALRADDGPATEEEETTEQSETAEAKSTAEEVKEAIRHAKEAARAASREAAKEAAEGTAAVRAIITARTAARYRLQLSLGSVPKALDCAVESARRRAVGGTRQQGRPRRQGGHRGERRLAGRRRHAAERGGRSRGGLERRQGDFAQGAARRQAADDFGHARQARGRAAQAGAATRRKSSARSARS